MDSILVQGDLDAYHIAEVRDAFELNARRFPISGNQALVDVVQAEMLSVFLIAAPDAVPGMIHVDAFAVVYDLIHQEPVGLLNLNGYFRRQNIAAQVFGKAVLDGVFHQRLQNQFEDRHLERFRFAVAGKRDLGFLRVGIDDGWG